MRRAPPDEEDDEGEEDEEESPRSRRRKGGAAAPEGVKEWSPEAHGDLEHGGWQLRGPKRPVYWRARDTWWFEPVVALAILLLLVVSLYAYTQNWPPVYVIESSSMQHGTNDELGLINTGDLVLAQKIDSSQVVPYMEGLQTGYTTYGEYGDVLLYYPNGDTTATPIIHRAILYLDWNALNNTYNASELSGLPCSPTSHPYYRTSNTPTTCATTGIGGQLLLYGIGWQGVTVDVQVGELGGHSGFLTMGDNNYQPGNPGTGDPDEPTLSSLVEPGWVLGVARGMVPWFGALKLLLQGDSSMVPSQSWQWLGLSIAGIVLIGLGLHLAIQRIERRREAERAGEAPSSDLEGEVGWLHRFVERLRRTAGEDGDEEEAEANSAPTKKHRTARIDPRHLGGKGGRPQPKVRRGDAHAKARDHHGHKPRSPGSDDRRL
jgi:signal peptidase I